MGVERHVTCQSRGSILHKIELSVIDFLHIEVVTMAI